ncbi:UNVERIFIED_CONTAM: hypothetical protein GTU68_056130 [Idotea baltica]|nr:hypothetical protein [Idotea baltica]
MGLAGKGEGEGKVEDSLPAELVSNSPGRIHRLEKGKLMLNGWELVPPCTACSHGVPRC